MKPILTLLLLMVPLRAEMTGSYTHFLKSSLSSSTIKLTVQQIASGTRDLHFVSVGLKCTVDATFTLSLNGTAASATSGTVKKNNPWQPNATATVWTASNVGSGTTHRTFDVIGGTSEQAFDLSRFIIPRGAGTGANLTVTSSSVTGDCSISIVWEEWR